MHTSTLDKIICGDIRIFKRQAHTKHGLRKAAARQVKREKNLAKRAFRRAAKKAATSDSDGPIIIARSYWA